MRGGNRSRRPAVLDVGSFRHPQARAGSISTKVLFFVIVAPMRKFRTWVLSALALLCIAAQAPGVAAVPDIYPDPGKANTDLAAALQSAAANHRRIILDFGGNWCTDCHVLDGYFHDAANRPILEADFLLVHVNIGRLDQNLDLAERMEIRSEKASLPLPYSTATASFSTARGPGNSRPCAACNRARSRSSSPSGSRRCLARLSRSEIEGAAYGFRSRCRPPGAGVCVRRWPAMRG